MSIRLPPTPASRSDLAGAQSAKWAEAEQVAKDFETMFMDLVVKGMRQTAKPEDSSNAGEIYTGMLDAEYAKAMTGAQEFGVREMILDWMRVNDPSFASTSTGREAIEGARAQALEAYKAQAKPTK